MKRSIVMAIERMKAASIPCWIETHTRMTCRLAMRIASLPDERWEKKATEWNPCFCTKHRTNRPVGRPKKRCEGALNDFFKPEETGETKGNEIKNNDTWIKVANNREWWKQWKVNTQRQQLQHLLTVCTASVDRHSVWTAWSWMYTRWWTSRSHSPRTRRTLIDTAAEPRHTIKDQEIEAF